MYIKTSSALTFIALSYTLLLMPNLHAKSFKINTSKSKVHWTGSKITEKHTGYVQIKSGNVIIENGKLNGGHIVIDMRSIRCDDIENNKYNKRLVRHLKGEDFFKTVQHPEASLKIRKSTKKYSGDYHIQADLTIVGETRPVEFTLHVQKKKKAYISTGLLTVNRLEWGIRYGSGKFFSKLGDRIIHDEFNLKFEMHTH